MRNKLLLTLFSLVCVFCCVFALAACDETPDNHDVAVREVKLEQSNVTLQLGDSVTLTATVMPENATNKTVNWSSENPAVVTVDSNGKVTAVSVGSAFVYAQCGGVNSACSVRVVPKVITLDQTSLSMEEGEARPLTATVNAVDEKDNVITWMASPSGVVDIVESSNFTRQIIALKQGAATVTVTTGNGYSATCSVTVSEKKIEINRVEINPDELELEVGDSAKLVSRVFPDNAPQAVQWTVSPQGIVTVDDNGSVKAVGAGEATITATAGKVSATCSVTVKHKVTAVNLDNTELTLAKGQSAKLNVTVEPAEFTEIEWTSYESSTVTVDQEGNVTAVGIGRTTIVVSAGGMSATCTVVVTVEEHECQWSTTWQKDGTHHWRDCTYPNCDKVDSGDHNFEWVIDEAPTVSETGIKHEECRQCGYVRNENTVAEKLPHECQWNTEWIYDETYHWHTCSVEGCDKLDKHEHELDANDVCTVCHNEKPTIDKLDFNFDGETAYVSGIKELSYSGKIVVPKYYQGHLVTSIYVDYSSSRCFVTELSIPSSVKVIGSFYNCPDLHTLTLAEGVESIGSYVFCYASIRSLHIPSTLKNIGEEAFVENAALESITVAEGNTKYKNVGDTLIEAETKTLRLIGKNAQIPDDGSVERIGGRAFAGSTHTSVVLPESIVYVDRMAFANCSSLTEIVIPKNVEFNPDSVFYNTNGITKVTAPAHVLSIVCKADVIEELTITGDSMGWSNKSFENSAISKLLICEGVKSLVSSFPGTFSRCNNLTSVSLPDSLIEIGDSAFAHCANLRTVRLGSSIETIGREAFRGCSNLQTVENMPSTIKFVGEYAFDNTAITGSELDDGYFLGNDDNPRVYLVKPKFSGTEYTVNASVKIIGSNAFNGLKNLSAVTLPEGVMQISNGAFNGSGITEIEIPDTVTYIGSSAFAYCEKLTNANIPQGITKLRDYTFEYCKSLQSVSLPASLKAIYSSCFMQCTSLTEIILPEGVDDIEEAFDYCSSLTKISIPSTLTVISAEWFEGCNSITDIIVAQDNPVYSGQGGCLIEKVSKTLVLGGIGAVIPSDGTVTSIGDYAFAYRNLTSIEIPANITIIGKNAFFRCDQLTEVTLNEGLVEIGRYAFWKDENLESIIIPSTVTRIGGSAFKDCKKLTNVSLGANLSEMESAVFENTAITVITIPEKVTKVGGGLFDKCTTLKTVVWNATACESAGTSSYSVFNNCNSVIELIIGDNVTSIADYTFAGCTNLDKIVIGKNVASISKSAFGECGKLQIAYFEGSAEEWSNVAVSAVGNTNWQSKLYFYSETRPLTEGRYWHYDGKLRVIWE